MTAARRVNDWLVRYPLSFALIVVALATLALSVVSLAQSARVDDNTQRIDHIVQRDCFVDAFQVVQAEAVLAAFTHDAARAAAAVPNYEHAKNDLARFNFGEHVTCHPMKP